nr:MAG TPA: hypothetical protein [Caudoviricetes sp.]
MKTAKTESRKLVNFSSYFKIEDGKTYGAAVLHCGKEVQSVAYNGGKSLHSIEGAVCAAACTATVNMKKGDLFTMIVDMKTLRQLWSAIKTGDVTEDFTGNEAERNAVIKMALRVPALRARGIVVSIRAHKDVYASGGYLAGQLPIWSRMATKAMNA